jgi:polyisoprenoid-binding protein YceI
MFLKLLSLSLALTSLTAFAKGETLNVDPGASKLVYVAKKVTGAEHTGEVKLASGTMSFEKDTLKSGAFEIDMTTISNTDITDKEYNTKFVGHLNSDDFFGTAKFKTAKIEIVSAKKEKGSMYKINGKLTIKGTTAPVTFEADVTKEKSSAVVVFDRTAFGIKYGSGKFFENLGDKMIKDEVQLTVALATKK